MHIRPTSSQIWQTWPTIGWPESRTAGAGLSAEVEPGVDAVHDELVANGRLVGVVLFIPSG